MFGKNKNINQEVPKVPEVNAPKPDLKKSASNVSTKRNNTIRNT